jgi:hypothetical protein
MNTNEMELKQGAVTTADLSPQQQPQMKDVEQKPSIASSDEERLATGISTIGLQTKRLSGAQRKRNLQAKPLHLRPKEWWRAVGM